MVTKPFEQQPLNAAPPDADYPDGSARNEAIPNVTNDGWALIAPWVKDLQGFTQFALSAANISADGSPDTALASQLFEALQTVFGSGNLVIFPTSSTYTTPPALTQAAVFAVGAGGGGGGMGEVSGFDKGGGGGGGGGGTAFKLISALDLGASQSVTIGAGGLGGTATEAGGGADDGGTGGTTSFGAILDAAGGEGAEEAVWNQIVNGGFGGAATGGDLNLPGATGMAGFRNIIINDAVNAVVGRSHYGGGGGASFFSGGANGRTVVVTANAGIAGGGPGAGGSGVAAGNDASTALGGAGANGIIVIWEQFG